MGQDFQTTAIARREEFEEDKQSDVSSDDERITNRKTLIHNEDQEISWKGGLTKRASLFFDQDIFKDIGGINEDDQDDSAIDMQEDTGNGIEEKEHRDRSVLGGHPRVQVSPHHNSQASKEFSRETQLHATKDDVRACGGRSAANGTSKQRRARMVAWVRFIYVTNNRLC